MVELDEHEALAHRLADAAGDVQRRWFRQPITIDTKPDDSPVTIADREAEAVMRELIRAAHPDHGILGEEHGSEGLDAEFVWILDPIDGTKSFITGRPLFGTLIALAHHGIPVLGVIDQSILRERWVGRSGRTTTWNGQPAGCRACPSLDAATLYVTTPAMFALPLQRAAFKAVSAASRLTMYGGDCYAYGQLASGFADLIVEASLEPYDFMALAPVVEGAGGIITDWSGEPLRLGSPGQVIAAGDRRCHGAALALLQER